MVGRHAAPKGGLSEQAKSEVRAKIKRLLNENDVTYEKLAYHLGLTPTSVSRLLNGQQWFTFEALVSVAEFFQVPLSDLFPKVRPGKAERHKPMPYTVSRMAIEAFAITQGVTAERLDKWKDSLPALERGIITLRYFVRPGLSLEKIGEMFGISKERVRQYEAGALASLN